MPSSDSYVAAYEAAKAAGKTSLSAEQKHSRLASVMKAADKMERIGQGMIGPIQIRLRYEGITRSVLVEDSLERGPVMPYDILDDLGQAQILNTTGAEIESQLMEGKQAFWKPFRVAAFPVVQKEDLYRMRVNVVEYAQDEARQAIMRTEDHYLITLLESAIVDRGANAGQAYGGTPTGITAGPTSHTYEKTVLTASGAPYEAVDFYTAAAMVELDMNEADTCLIHPQDLRDLYLWDTNVTGWEFKDDVVARGRKITQYGEFKFIKSIIIPQGETFLVSPPEWTGNFPVYYSLEVDEDHRPEKFLKGWVMDEMVGMMVLNPRSLARLVKTATYSDLPATVGSGAFDASVLGTYY